MHELFLLFLLFLTLVGSVALFRYGLAHQWFFLNSHPYTQKKERTIYYDYVQLIVMFFASMISLLLVSVTIAVVFACIFLFFLYSFLKKHPASRYGITRYEWVYEEQTVAQWKEKKTTFPSLSKKGQTIHPITDRVVFTDFYIYTTKRQRFSVFRDHYEQLDLKRVYIDHSFLVFEYAFFHAISVRQVALYIPPTKQQEAKEIVAFYTALLSTRTSTKKRTD